MLREGKEKKICSNRKRNLNSRARVNTNLGSLSFTAVFINSLDHKETGLFGTAIQTQYPHSAQYDYEICCIHGGRGAGSLSRFLCFDLDGRVGHRHWIAVIPQELEGIIYTAYTRCMFGRQRPNIDKGFGAFNTRDSRLCLSLTLLLLSLLPDSCRTRRKRGKQ